MREIFPDLLWMGNAHDIRPPDSANYSGIRAVVDLAIDEPPATLPREIIYCRIPIVDGSGNPDSLLQLAIECVASLISAKIGVLVCCSAGMSRSPAIVAAAISRIEEIELDEALKTHLNKLPHDISPGLWKQIALAQRFKP